MDMLLATGEQISIALLAMAIHTLGETAVSFTGAQVGIVTDSTHTKARIKSINTGRMRQAVEQGNIVIVAGFQGIDENFNITTLGRGGSDTTAVALAAVLKHDQGAAGGVGCEIYTDVDGVYTTDPRLVPEARKLEAISYDEMLELASAGAAVMHSRSIEFAKKYDVPVMVRSSFSDVEGTWIVPESGWMRDVVVCGVALVRDEARVHLDGLPDRPGVSHRVSFLGAVSDAELPGLYRNALAVLYVPFDEDYGLVTLEGFLAAKPVVTATDSGGTREFVEDGVTGLVTAPEPRAIGEAIAQLHGARHMAAALGAAGRERARAITWDSVIDRLTSHG